MTASRESEDSGTPSKSVVTVNVAVSEPESKVTGWYCPVGLSSEPEPSGWEELYRVDPHGQLRGGGSGAGEGEGGVLALRHAGLVGADADEGKARRFLRRGQGWG